MSDPANHLLRSNRKEQRLLRYATYASAGVASVLIATKFVAWIMTDSVSMLTTLVDSMLDLVASLIILVAVRKAMVPADDDHRFGHGKAEPLAALAQSGFIAGSALLLFFESVDRVISPHPIQQTDVGLAVMALSLVLTLALVAFQRYVMSLSGSIAIKADSQHYRADILANLGVIGALVVSGYLDIPIVDALFGLVISLVVGYSAWDVGSDAMHMLMDRELPDEDRDRIKHIAFSYHDVKGIHDLRTRRSGPDTFIQMHLEFNGRLSLNRAHTVADAVEKEVMEGFPGAEVLVHMDPVTPHAGEEAVTFRLDDDENR